MFQKWTVFVFAESWSRDQLMQKAYWYKRNSSLFDSLQTCCIYLATGHQSEIDFLKVVRMVSWSGVVGPGTNFRSLARSCFALGARTITLRAHCRATRSKGRLVSKSTKWDSLAFKENLLHAIILFWVTIQARLHMYVVTSGALILGINGED